MKKKLTNEQAQFLYDLTLKYGDILTKYAYRFFGYQPHRFQNAQDAVQETFVKAVQDVENLMEHPNKAAWLKVSLRFTLFNMQRNPHWKLEELQATVKEAPTRRLHVVLDAFDRLERYPRLTEVIAVAEVILTEEEFDTFYDHFLAGMTTEETAFLEGVSNDTVRGRISRIRKKLRKHFGLTCYFFFFLFYR